MTLSTPSGFTANELLFQESFPGATLGPTWHTYVTSNAANGWPWNDDGAGGSCVGGPYFADYDKPSQVSVSNGLLSLTAIKQSIVGVNGGQPQTFPVTSGVISSYGNLELNGGYLQISMKAPDGNGAWPSLWMLPGQGAGSSGDNFEIDIQEGGFTGSGPANQAYSWHLHTPSGTAGGVIDSGIDLTAGFHTYAINWVSGQSITWYLDGNQMAQVTSAQYPIPNEPMHLIMNSGVANSNAAGWHTAFDASTPQSMQMQVDEIQLYQSLPDTGGEAWPIGSVFISVVDTNPATLLGYGTWVAIGAGRGLVGFDGADPDFNAAEKIGGEKKHILTIAEMPPHGHSLRVQGKTTASATGGHILTSSATGTLRTVASTDVALSTGGGLGHNNLAPYLTVFFWKRTA